MNSKEKYQELWEERIKNYEDSGLSIKSWCETNEIKLHQFNYWRRKFKKKQEVQNTLIPIDLSQMTLKDDSSIKLNIGKINLEIKSGFNPSLLKEVLKVLIEL